MPAPRIGRGPVRASVAASGAELVTRGGSRVPGAYAHITAVNRARALARKAGLSKEALLALGQNFSFAELGCVSPDYPYLGGPGQGYWADQMHYTNTAMLLRVGVAAVRKRAGEERARASSWLLGFAGHMAADMTIHPVVEGIVGPYERNKAAHRLCEMHQDALIFSTLDLGDAGVTKHLNTGIGSCNAPNNSLDLDPTIKAVWLEMLAQAYPVTTTATASGRAEPKPHLWHAGFCGALKSVGVATTLFPFARHVAANEGLAYPLLKDVSDTYVKNLKTPEGPMSYEALFDFACQNVVTVWKGLDAALNGTSAKFLQELEDWNLDTGKSVKTGKYVFWRVGA